MRRLTGLCALALLLAPIALRVAAAAEDSAALRCAIACGHAATPGAACCPMSGADPKEAALAACPKSDPASAVPGVPAQPGLVAAVYRPAPPERGSISEPIASAAPRSTSPRPPDHVPLPLS